MFGYSVEVQAMLFMKHFLFFPPGESALISFGHLSYGGFYNITGDGFAVPLYPLGHSQLKTWKNGAKQISKHFTGLQKYENKRLGMKAINATHTQARTIIT
ncbi:MAG: hypothetical protein L6V95_15135 [Candidatus Melainabacteria bacterium]|nr:MAG: hypothetical protein L6V95_15135 [Candidatus Melainabacteria bacterium]